MRVGERVSTPKGLGQVVAIGTHRVWAGVRTIPLGYVRVELDPGERSRSVRELTFTFNPSDVTVLKR